MIKSTNETSPTLLNTLFLLFLCVGLSLLPLTLNAAASPPAQQQQEQVGLDSATAAPKLTPQVSPPSSPVTARTLQQILRQIDTYYVDKVNVNQLLEKAIKDVFKQLDPHSSYLNEHDLNALFDLANGKYNGLGIEVEVRDQHLVVLATIKNSPAETAGLLAGDIIKSIDGISVAEKSLNQVSQAIKQSGQKTTLVISRDFYDKPLEFMLEKADIVVESVDSKLLDNNIAYIKIHSFQSNTTNDLEKHINQLKTQSQYALRGLLLDLRDNPGGVLESAVGVSDLFLNSGTIVTTRGRFNDANRNFYATSGDILKDRPIYILINKGSASAAEIVAGALKENDRATVVGVQSFGKGSVQSLIPLGNGNTAIKLTTALYYTPGGLSINGIGITPDVEVQQHSDTKPNEVMKDLEEHWGLSGTMLANRDFQLDAAQKLVLKQLLH
jgi:carboxyl-terminal processing protease